MITMMFDDSPQILTESECLALLRSCTLGRISFASGGEIEIFPVNYGIEGSIIVFRSGPGTKLDAVPNTAVAFEVDGWDAESGRGWSVVAKGRAEEITTNSGRSAEHLRLVHIQPAAPGDKWHWLAIQPSEIAGRRFHVPPSTRERA